MYKILRIIKHVSVVVAVTILHLIFTQNAYPIIIKPQVFVTPKNITIILLENPNTDLIYFNLSFKGAGTKNDLVGKEGLTYITKSLLNRSPSDNLDRNERIKLLREIGVFQDVNFKCDYDNIYLTFKCPEENFLKTLKVISGMLINSDLNNSELTKLKNFNNTIQLEKTSEVSFASEALSNKVFINHPYGLPILGLPNSIQKITLNDIKNTIKVQFAKNNLIISVVGNINQKTITNYIDQAFIKLPEKAKLNQIPEASLNLDGSFEKIVKNSPQCGVYFALKAPKFNSKEYYPMLVINRIFAGASFTSRLWNEVREKRGLVYEISSYIENSPLGNLLLMYFKCDNKDYQEVVKLIKNEMINLQTNGITPEELSNAKKGLIGEFALEFMTNENINSKLLDTYLLAGDVNIINEFNHKINAVSLEDLNVVIKKYFNIKELTGVLVGNA